MNKHEVRWNKMYDLAKEFFNKYGNLCVPFMYGLEGEHCDFLDSWVICRRDEYNKGLLSREKINLLNSIGMVWEKSPYTTWLGYFNLAQEFYKKNGHLNISSTYIMYGVKIGAWISRQRYLKNEWELGYEEFQKLNSIGMIWNSKRIQWFEYYQLAKDFYNNYGHLNIPKDYEINGIKLGEWLNRERYLCGSRWCDCIEKRKQKLDAIGMNWNVSKAYGTSFPEYFIYSILKKHYGNNKVLYRNKSLGFELDVYIPHLKVGIEFDGAKWHNDEKDVNKDFKASSKGITLYRLREPGLNNLETSNCFCLENSSSDTSSLTSEIYDIISNEFDIVVDYSIEEIYNEYATKYLNTNSWDEYFKLAKKFYKKNCHLRIRVIDEFNGVKIGSWISRQRQAYKKGTLSYSQIDKLNSIGMVWEIKQQKKRAA